MQIISIVATILGILITIYISYRRGDFRRSKIYFSPSKLIRRKKNFLRLKKPKPPIFGVINFFLLPPTKHKKICFHLYFTIENLTRHPIEDASITLTYSRRLCDETDKQFFENKGTARELEIVFVDNDTVQVTYSYQNLHPNSAYQIIHPILFTIEDCNIGLSYEDDLFYEICNKDFSIEMIGYRVSAKNLSKPIMDYFPVMSTIGTSYERFFKTEKKLLYALTKKVKLNKYVFERRDIDLFQEGKNKKDILVVPLEKMKVGYVSFPRLKEPYSQTFNFEQKEEI